MDRISFYLVFLEGIASFLSPCLLPLLPVYVGYLSGEITGGKPNKRILIINSFIFCIGLSIVFVLMGVTASSIGSFLSKYKLVLTKVAAVIIILFGLFHMGLIKLDFLYRERRFNINFKKSSPLNSFIFGMTFAFGWTPCIGPVLGSVLIIAGSAGSAAYGAFLLSVYAIGLSVPFIITATLLDLISYKLKSVQRYTTQINIIGGLVLIILGIALYAGWLQTLAYISWR